MIYHGISMAVLSCAGLLAEAEKPPEEGDAPGGGVKPAGLSAAPKPGSYVPPSVRNRWGRTLQLRGCCAQQPLLQY